MLGKKILFWLVSVIIVGGLVSGSTDITQAILPGIFVILAGLELWGEAKPKGAILLLGVLGLLINVAIVSWVDAILWGLVVYVWYTDKN